MLRIMGQKEEFVRQEIMISCRLPVRMLDTTCLLNPNSPDLAATQQRFMIAAGIPDLSSPPDGQWRYLSQLRSF